MILEKGKYYTATNIRNEVACVYKVEGIDGVDCNIVVAHLSDEVYERRRNIYADQPQSRIATDQEVKHLLLCMAVDKYIPLKS